MELALTTMLSGITTILCGATCRINGAAKIGTLFICIGLFFAAFGATEALLMVF